MSLISMLHKIGRQNINSNRNMSKYSMSPISLKEFNDIFKAEEGRIKLIIEEPKLQSSFSCKQFLSKILRILTIVFGLFLTFLRFSFSFLKILTLIIFFGLLILTFQNLNQLTSVVKSFINHVNNTRY